LYYTVSGINTLKQVNGRKLLKLLKLLKYNSISMRTWYLQNCISMILIILVILDHSLVSV